MKTYITRTGQNIYDIALQLYGSIEGIIDLLTCNSSMKVTDYGPPELEGEPLSFATSITRGIILQYHESLVLNDNIKQEFENSGIIPANGNRSCNAYNFRKEKKRIIIHQVGDTAIISGKVGKGIFYIDWGDFGDVKTLNPNDGDFSLEHIYRSAEDHTIMIMGDFVMDSLDLSHCNGIAYPLNTIDINGEFINNNKTQSLNALFNSQKK